MTENSQQVVNAGFWWRVLASFIDLPVLIFLSVTIAFVVDLYFPDGIEDPAAFGIADKTFGIICWLYFTVVYWLYFALMESSRGQGTVGKMACGLKVTGLNGKRISFLRATVRYLAKFLSFLIFLIGYLMVGLTRRKQGLHDIVAGTLVVREADQVGEVMSHRDLITRRLQPPGGAAEEC